ncbi:MAG TPA: hypothetical protein VHT30_00305 [Acidimicrobiales bacterium]|nr:hypothetical protein [Acidimicrobiales bacterium]
MAWTRRHAGKTEDLAPWEGPFAPDTVSQPVRVNPMVKTAAELVTAADPADPAVPPAVAA